MRETTRMSEHSYSLVSVVFESEVQLQWLQARSLDRYVEEGLFDQILLIDNSANGLRRGSRRDLLSEYGRHRSRVHIVRSTEIVDVPRTVGWMSQQILKLAVSRLVATSRYLLLDAKNHAIAPLHRGFIEAPDGRTRVNVHSYESHSLRGHLAATLRYVDLDPEAYLPRFTVTATPFVFDTQQVKQLIGHMEQASGSPFSNEFVDRGLTEFFLYSAWLLAQGHTLDDYFELEQTPCPTVWPGTASAATVRQAIRQADADNAPLFSVHRKALARLDAQSLDQLARFWAERGLFDDSREAHGFLQRNRRSYLYGETRRRLRESPHIVRRRLASGRS